MFVSLLSQLLSRRVAIVGIATGVLLRWLLNFETAADLKFIFGVGFFFRFHQRWTPIPDEHMIMPCSELSRGHIQTSLVPIIFQGCIPNSAQWDDYDKDDIFNPFPESVQNLFAACPGGKVQGHNHHFTVDPLHGNETRHIIEKDPCLPGSLAHKIALHQRHNVTADVPYFDIHSFHINAKNAVILDRSLKAHSLVPEDFTVQIPGQTTVLVHYLAAAITAVDYSHSHLDRFLSFGTFKGTNKTWELMSPYQHDCYEYEYSGKAIVLTKEICEAKKTIVIQAPGDILYVPPFWLHKTTQCTTVPQRQSKEFKSISFNLHYTTRRSLMGVLAWVFMGQLQMSDWFFGKGGLRDTMLTASDFFSGIE